MVYTHSNTIIIMFVVVSRTVPDNLGDKRPRSNSRFLRFSTFYGEVVEIYRWDVAKETVKQNTNLR